MRTLFLAVFVFVAGYTFGQAPIIQKIEPLVTFPNDTIIISGNGFSATASDLQVWFGPVTGTIVTSTTFAIEVIVPASASVCNIEVRNKLTGLSARSAEKFMPSFNGTNFTTTKFTAPLEFNSSNEYFDLCACDFNFDSKPDIAATKFLRTSSPRFPNPTDITLLRNTSTPGNLAFTSQSIVLNIGTDNAICGDVDGDGKADLLLTRSGAPRNSVHLLRNTTAASGGTVTFATPGVLFLETGHFATRMSLFDLNKDGKSDLVVSNSSNDQFYIYTNTSTIGAISFSTPLKLSIKSDEAVAPIAYETEVQDFNGDGLPDILIGNFQNSNLFIFKNTSSGSMSFASVQKITMTGFFNRMVTYDFNGDHKLDIAVTSTTDDKVSILLNESTSTTLDFADPVIMPASLDPWGIDLGDIDGDGDADLMVANKELSPTATEDINIFQNNGTSGTAFTKTNITTTIPTRNLKVMDFDGDAKPDIAYTSYDETIGSARALVGIMRNTNCHQPEILNTAPISICAGQTIRLQTIPANNVTYTWKKDNVATGANQPFLDITAAGTYTVTATGEGGSCEITSQSLVVTSGTGAAPATPDITSNAPLCSGQQLNLQTTAVPSATYIWTGPNGFTSSTQNPSKTVSANDAGEYTLQVQVGVCKSNIATARVDVVDFADFRVTSNSASSTLCNGAAVTLSVNNLANHTYQWKRNGALITPAQTGATFNPALSGSYSVVVTHSILGCSDETDPVSLTFVAPATASFTVEDGCVGETLQFNNTSTTDANGTPVYAWTFGDSQSSNLEDPTHVYSAGGNFTARLNITYQGITGCASNEASDVVAILAANVPVITPSATSACEGTEVTLAVQTGFTTVQWNTTPVSTGEQISVPPGTYTVSTVDANACEGTAQITIAEIAAPDITITATPETIIAGESTQLSATPDNLISYAWTPSETLSDPTIANPIASPVTNTTYTVVGVNSDNCSAQAEISIIVTPPGDLPFPVAFSPNGDGSNDVWEIGADSKPECTLSVFDGRGRKVFEKKGQNWDGTFNGTKVPDGTYYYVYGCPDVKPRTGNVLVFK